MVVAATIGSAVAGPLINGMMSDGSSPQPQPQNNGYGAPMIGQGISSYMGAQASKEAAQIGADAADRATATQQAMYQQSRDDNAPYMQNGNVALSSMMGKINNGQLGGQFTGADYLANKDPGYDFQLQQGNQALQNSQAAHDGVMSGAALKGLINYNQGTAATGYQNAYQRWMGAQQNTFSQLSHVAGMGQNNAANLGYTGAAYGKGISETITGAGNARAAGVMGAANATGSGINSIAGMSGVGNLIGNAIGGMFNTSGPEQYSNVNVNPGSNDYFGSSSGNSNGGYMSGGA